MDEPRRRQAPFRSESEVYSYGTAHGVPYSHRNRLQQSPLTRERLPRPAHRVTIMFLFWTALLMHAAQKRNHLPTTRAFGFGMPNQHGVCPSHPAPAEFPLQGSDCTPRVSWSKYSFWLSPSRNGLDVGSPAEASPFLAVLPRLSGMSGCVCVPIVDNISHGLHPTENAVRSAAESYSEALRGLSARSTTVGMLLHRPGIGTTGPLALLTFGRRVTDFPPCRKAHASALHVS